MKRIIRIIGKVVLAVILLFLCLCSKPVNATENQETAEKFSAIKQAIEDEQGGLFETTIGNALGGIAEAVFSIATSDVVNLGFKNYDELIFNKTVYTGSATEDISPFDSNTWSKVMKWYKFFSSLSFILILIGCIVTSYKFIIAGTSLTSRNEAKDSLMRLFLGGASIAIAPIFVKLVLLINSNMVSALVSRTSGGLDGLLGNGIFTQIKTGNPIATALVICLFAYLFVKFNIKFIIRKFTLIVFTVFTPLISGMWIINKNVTGAAIWFGQILINAFMQFIYAFLFLIYMEFTTVSDGWAVSLLWAMMILPLGDVLLNTMQNLVSRIAGLNNEEMANRGIGMGAAMAGTVHSIGAQFISNNENNNDGFINRTKNVNNQTSETKTENSTSVNNVSKTEQRNTNNVKNDNKKSSGISLYGIGRSFLNTGMFLAEGRNFSESSSIGNRRNYGQNMRRNEIDSNVTHSLEREKGDVNEDE